MSKKKHSEVPVSDIRGALAKKFGPSYKAGNVPPIKRLRTGFVSLDRILGGGLPVGRIIQFAAGSSCGKTTLALQILASIQEAGYEGAYVDLEHTVDQERIHALGVNLDKLHYYHAPSGTDALEYAVDCAELGVKLVVIDSVPYLLPRPRPGEEIEIGEQKYAPQARLLSQSQPILVPAMDHNECILLFVNQMRTQVGQTYGNPEKASGGLALRYMSSVILELRSKEVYKDGSGKRIVVRTMKNKTAGEGKTCELDLIFDTGFDAVDSLRAELEAHGYITRKGSWFSWSPESLSLLGMNSTQIGQGSKSVCDLLRSSPDIYGKLYDIIVSSQTSDVLDLSSTLLSDEQNTDQSTSQDLSE